MAYNKVFHFCLCPSEFKYDKKSCLYYISVYAAGVREGNTVSVCTHDYTRDIKTISKTNELVFMMKVKPINFIRVRASIE